MAEVLEAKKPRKTRKKKSKLVLPKVYMNDASGNYPQHVGKPKISYSQFSSWKEDAYREDYIRQYFMGGPYTSNQFAEFGSCCGEYLEKLAVNTDWLSDNDVEILKQLERPENAIYEGEIVIDMGTFVIQGFIDQEWECDKGLNIKDLKTGNADKKVEYYGGDDYQQTTIYSYAREQEGFTINSSSVTLLGRKGNGFANHPLRLSGEIIEIPTPYSKERAEIALQRIREVAHEISEAYQLYLKTNI